MSRTRHRRRPVRTEAVSHAPRVEAFSLFDGANFSPNRGYIFVPTLDTAKEIDTYSHWELVKKARWFYGNSGFARRVVNGAGQMVGYLTPRPLTTDSAWNRLAEANWENRAGSAQVFDVMGKHNVYSLQPKLISRMLLDGDILLALTKTSTDGAAVMPYEGHQIGNSAATDPKLFRNGVRTNGFGRHLAYRILNGDGSYDISATDACYVADFERINQVRGLTAFAHAINHLHDRTDIVREIKLSGKLANGHGFYRTRPGEKAKAGRAMGGRTVVAPDTSKPDSTIELEQFYRGGLIGDLANGEELKVLLDSRPHPNLINFDQEVLIRDMSWGFGLAPELLWRIERINSASNRLLLADAVKWVEQKQQLLVDCFLTRYWVYHMACEMKAGRLRQCEDPEWWKVGWIPQPKLTVDRAKDGKLNIDMHRAGMMTLKRHYAEQFSEDWKPNISDWAEEKGQMLRDLMAHGFTRPEAVAMMAAGGSIPANVTATEDEPVRASGQETPQENPPE